MGLGCFVPMLVGFVGLVLVRIDWRASATIFAALLFDFFAMVAAAIPPGSQGALLMFFVVGALIGGIVCWGDERRPAWQLPLVAAATMVFLCLRWIDGIEILVRGWWLFAARLVMLPAGMLAVLVVYQRVMLKRSRR